MLKGTRPRTNIQLFLVSGGDQETVSGWSLCCGVNGCEGTSDSDFTSAPFQSPFYAQLVFPFREGPCIQQAPTVIARACAFNKPEAIFN